MSGKLFSPVFLLVPPLYFGVGAVCSAVVFIRSDRISDDLSGLFLVAFLVLHFIARFLGGPFAERHFFSAHPVQKSFFSFTMFACSILAILAGLLPPNPYLVFVAAGIFYFVFFAAGERYYHSYYSGEIPFSYLCSIPASFGLLLGMLFCDRLIYFSIALFALSSLMLVIALGSERNSASTD